MDIDEVYPTDPNMNNSITNPHSIHETEDFDMMIDDEYEQLSMPTNPSTPLTTQMSVDTSLGTSASKWASAPNTARHCTTTLAYLDNDPTLVAPKRPFRPEHQAYEWASNMDHHLR